jgi:hypothetical protein
MNSTTGHRPGVEFSRGHFGALPVLQAGARQTSLSHGARCCSLLPVIRHHAPSDDDIDAFSNGNKV